MPCSRISLFACPARKHVRACTRSQEHGTTVELLHDAPAFSFLFAAVDTDAAAAGGGGGEVRACLPGGGGVAFTPAFCAPAAARAALRRAAAAGGARLEVLAAAARSGGEDGGWRWGVGSWSLRPGRVPGRVDVTHAAEPAAVLELTANGGRPRRLSDCLSLSVCVCLPVFMSFCLPVYISGSLCLSFPSFPPPSLPPSLPPFPPSSLPLPLPLSPNLCHSIQKRCM